MEILFQEAYNLLSGLQFQKFRFSTLRKWQKIMRVSSLIFSCLIFLLTACGGNRVSYNGVSWLPTDKALERLKNSNDASEQLRVLSQIEEESSKRFDWNLFWSTLEQQDFYDHFDERVKTSIHKLHRLSCQQDHFNGFINFVVSRSKKIEFLTPPLRTCLIPIDLEMTQNIVRKLANPQSPQPQTSSVIHLLVLEASLSPEQNWNAVLKTFSESDWNKISHSFFENKQFEIVFNVIDLQNRYLGYSSILNETALPMFKDAKAFDKGVKTLGFEQVLHLFYRLPLQFLVNSGTNVLKERILEFIDQIGNEFLSHGENSKDLVQAWSNLRLIRLIENELSQFISTGNELEWLEGIHRKFEKVLRSAGIPPALDFLDKQSSESLEILWFKFRLRPDRFRVDWNPTLHDVNQRVERVLKARLLTHLSPSAKQLFEAFIENRPPEYFRDQLRVQAEAVGKDILHFCDLLKELGIPNTKVINHLELEKALLKPGCVEIDRPINIQSDSFQMAFDSALLSPGMAVQIKGTKGFDGSFIYTSSNSIWPSLPTEPTPASYNAVAFPIEVGIQTLDPSTSKIKQINKFVIHHTLRKAKKGPLSEKMPKKGFSGGNISLENSNSVSFLPLMVSQGGPGQKGAPPREGGLGAVSFVGIGKLVQWNIDIGASFELTHNGISLNFHSNPGVEKLREIIRSGERTEPDSEGKTKVKVYIDNKYLDFISKYPFDEPRVEQYPISEICKEFKTVDDCLLKLAYDGMHQVQSELQDSNLKDYDLLLRTSISPFIEPQGEIGDINLDGEWGDSGVIDLKGFAL